MAIKTFQCVICNAEVTKPQSYSYKDGRACRHHPEVQEAHAASEQTKKEDIEQSKQRAENPGWRWKNNQPELSHEELMASMGIKDPNKHCWCCHKDGAYEHIIMERFLINMSKTELRSSEPIPAFEFQDGSFLPNQQVLEAVRSELGAVTPLRRIEVSNDYPDWKLNQVLNRKGKEDKKHLVRMTGMIVLCRDCSKEYDFPWKYRSETAEKHEIERMMLVGQLVKPVIEKIAAGEIAQEELSTIMKK